MCRIQLPVLAMRGDPTVNEGGVNQPDAPHCALVEGGIQSAVIYVFLYCDGVLTRGQCLGSRASPPVSTGYGHEEQNEY